MPDRVVSLSADELAVRALACVDTIHTLTTAALNQETAVDGIFAASLIVLASRCQTLLSISEDGWLDEPLEPPAPSRPPVGGYL